MRQIAAVILLGLLPFNAAWSASDDASSMQRFVEGVHYERLEVPVATRDKDKVEVVEMFSYACVHCFNFDPYVKAWQEVQPEHVDFHLVPAVFNPDWEKLAQAFYTAETLGVTGDVHKRLFQGVHAFHEDLRQPEILAPIFTNEAEVSEEDFFSAHGSFSVRSRVQQAKALARAYRVTGVPAMIVNGKFRTDGRMAGNNAAMLEVVDFLVAKEAAEKASASQ